MTLLLDLWDRPAISFSLPEWLGGVISNQFYPELISNKNIFSKYGNPLIGEGLMDERKVSDLNEFEKDFKFMISFINSRKLRSCDSETFFIAVGNSVENHICQFGRIFFSDLCSYIDVASHIMNGCGFSRDLIQQIYLGIIYMIANDYGDLVKDSEIMGMIVPFTLTNRYKIIKQLVD